jgi:hypothetical protein
MTAVAVCSGCPARARAVPVGISTERLTSLMDSHVVLRLQSVSPFTSPCGGATLDLLTPSKKRRLRRPSPHHRVAGPFRLWLIGSTYRPSDGVGLHRSCLRTIFSRRRHASPTWSLLRQSAAIEGGTRIGALVNASSKGGEWRTTQAENAVSRSHLAWPLRHAAFSGPPGGDALAAYLRGCGVRARCSVRARTRTGRLWRFVILLSSPHPFF